MPNYKRAVLIWGTQLSQDYHTALREYPHDPVILIEAQSVCRKYRYHQQKLVMVLSAMRHFAGELRASGREVWYKPLDGNWDITGSPRDFRASSRLTRDNVLSLQSLETHTGYYDNLAAIVRLARLDTLAMMDTSDRAPRRLTEAWCKREGLRFEVTPNGLFLTTRHDFSNWVEGRRRLLMEDFYRFQRARLNLLMTGHEPLGGRWNFDADNRRPLPAGEHVPPPPVARPDATTREVIRLVSERFSDHPGRAAEFWLPVTRAEGLTWLEGFIHERLPQFGAYEDAMRIGEATLYHSVMTPLLNTGLIHPSEVVGAVTQALARRTAPLAAVEGYVRQVVGWREFMHAMYHYKDASWRQSNYFEFTGELPSWWYTGDTQDPALRDVITRALRYGYLHHIERLMVAGNYMLLSEYAPQAVYRWFMEVFIDAYEWVMVPNIIGMSQYADGGTFATKPYVASGAYLQKMGRWYDSPQAAKQSEFTRLYWQWLEQQRPRLGSNQRMSMMYRLLDQRGTTHDTAAKAK